MSITMAIVSGVKGDFPSTHVIAERAAELKKYLKKYAGSKLSLRATRYSGAKRQHGHREPRDGQCKIAKISCSVA